MKLELHQIETKKVGAFWFCGIHGKPPEPKPFFPLHTFSSIGREVLDDIAIGVKGGNIQTILVESEQAVQQLENTGHIQWLDMHFHDYLLANPLRSVIHGGRERYLIVIDALDEAGEAGRNPLVEMLARNAQRLPDWLGLVVTSRPEFDVKTPLQALNPYEDEGQSSFDDVKHCNFYPA